MAKWMWLCLLLVSATQNRGEENSVGDLGDLGVQPAAVDRQKSGSAGQLQTKVNQGTPEPLLLSALLPAQVPAAFSKDTLTPSHEDGTLKQNTTENKEIAGSPDAEGVNGGLFNLADSKSKSDRQGVEEAEHVAAVADNVNSLTKVAEHSSNRTEVVAENPNNLTEADNTVNSDAQSRKEGGDPLHELNALFDNIYNKQDEGAFDLKHTGDEGQSPTYDQWKAGQQQRENDEPVEEGQPDSVEITLPPTPSPLSTGEGVEKAADPNNTETVQTSHNSLDTEEGEGDSIFGNPPIFSASDLQNLAANIPDDLSPEEREELRQNISDSLGLSAFGPGLAMLPHGQNIPVQSTEKATRPQPSAAFLGNNSPSLVKENPAPSHLQSLAGLKQVAPSSPSSDKSIQDGLVSLGDAAPALMSVNNTADSDNRNSAEQETEFNKDDTKLGEDENKGFEGGESYGRKMLNDEAKEADDYNTYEEGKPDKGYEDDYDYEDDDREDYVGGDVHLLPVSTTPWSLDGRDGNGDAAQDLNSLAGDDHDTRDNAETVDADAMPSDWKNTEDDNDYVDDDDDWYYNPDSKPISNDKQPTSVSGSSSSTIIPGDKAAATRQSDGVNNNHDSQQESNSQILAPDFKEGVISTEDVHKKALQAPKGTIILYTALIVVFIAGIVLFSLWKNPFKGHSNNRPTHQLPVVRTGEEGKRLLDHPFV